MKSSVRDRLRNARLLHVSAAGRFAVSRADNLSGSYRLSFNKILT